MSGFRFTLEKALELRRLQLQIAEAAFQLQGAVVLELDRTRDDLRASRANAEAEVRAGGSVPGCALAALGAFRLHMQAKEREVAQRRADEEKKLDGCRNGMLGARRRCRLMERLKERRRLEWDSARARELEELAAESFLAKWNRGQA